MGLVKKGYHAHCSRCMPLRMVGKALLRWLYRTTDSDVNNPFTMSDR